MVEEYTQDDENTAKIDDAKVHPRLKTDMLNKDENETKTLEHLRLKLLVK